MFLLLAFKGFFLPSHSAIPTFLCGGITSPTVIIAPITSRIHTKAKLPTHTLIKDFDGLDKNSIILFEQIRTIDKQRLREYLGTLDRRFIHYADKALAISIGLAKKD